MREAPPPTLKLHRMHGMLRVAHHLHSNWDSVLGEPDLRFDSVQASAHAAPSQLHGTGLFASEPIEAGQLVTLYPIHALGDATTCLTCDEDGRDAELFGEKGRTDWPYRVDLPVSPGLAGWAEDLWVDTNPTRDARSGWLGHLVNEGVACAGSTEPQIVDYYAETLRRANCFLVPFGDTPLMCWAATRAVAAGEELLGVYGHDYWCARDGGGGGGVPSYTPEVLRAAQEWKAALSACRASVQEEYEAEVAALGGLFEYADAQAREEAGGGGGGADDDGAPRGMLAAGTGARTRGAQKKRRVSRRR